MKPIRWECKAAGVYQHLLLADMTPAQGMTRIETPNHCGLAQGAQKGAQPLTWSWVGVT